MHEILFFLNEAKDLDLVATTRNFLNKRNIEYEISTIGLNISDGGAIGGHQRIKPLIKIFNNWKLKKNLIENIEEDLSESQYKALKRFLLLVETIPRHDLFCFSCYDNWVFQQVAIALALKQKYPNAKFLFGGPEIKLNESTRRYLTALDIDWSVGDVDASIYNALFNDKVQNLDNYSTLNHLTENDVPIYSDSEINVMLSNRVRVQLSRGCSNSCFYCPTPALYRNSYNAVSREVGIKWLEKLANQGMKFVSFGDSNLNIFDFDLLLNGMLELNNKYSLQCNDSHSVYVTLKNLTESQIEKMSMLMPRIAPGIECIHPEIAKLMNKKHPTFEEIYNLSKMFDKYNFEVSYQYIIGFPGHNDKNIDEELNLLKVLSDSFPHIRFCVYQYRFIPSTYVYKNYKSFNCDVHHIDEVILNNLDNELKYIFGETITMVSQPRLEQWIDKCYNTLNRVDIQWDGPRMTKNFDLTH